MKSPALTIIIPTYNSGEFIVDALNSIQKQTFPDYEVLVMDNVSTDRTVELVSNFAKADRRFVLISEKDEGIYHAMNKGIEAARGEWIFFMGSDDTLYDTNVLEQINRIINEAADVKFIYGNVRHYKHPDKPGEFRIYDGPFDGEKLLGKNICHQSIFYHHLLFQQFGGFRTKYNLTADWDFNLRCFNLVKTYYCDIIISNFYAGGRSGKFVDYDFYDDMLSNMIFEYPYHYKSIFFQNKRKMIVDITINKLRRLNLFKALKASRVLFYHLRTTGAGSK